MKYKKIHICGTYGSGKTTLAKQLSKILKIPYYSFDDIKYSVKFTKKRPLKERLSIVKNITSKKKFITEGAWSNYGEESFKNSDLIIIVKTNPIVCIYQIIKRYIIGDREIKNDFKTAYVIMKKVFVYYFTKDTISLYSHMNLINKYKKDYIIIKNKKDKLKFLRNLK